MGCSSSIADVTMTRQKPDKNPTTNLTKIPVAPTDDGETRTKVSILLSPEQKESIRKSWKFFEKDMEGFGKQIFLKIFEEKPQLKDLFPFRCVWGDRLISHPAFKKHANRFMSIIEEGISNMDHLDYEYTPKLLDLGGRHTKFSGFKASNFLPFQSAILFILKRELKMDFTNDTENT